MRRALPTLVFGVLLAAGCAKAPAPKAPDEHLPRLETVTPTKSLLPVRAELSCTVEAFEKADLCARVPGVVEYLKQDIDIGRPIKEGEPLIHLAVPELVAQEEHKAALLEQVKRQKAQAREARSVAEKELQEAREQEKRYAAEHAFRKLEYQRVSELVRRDATTREREQESKRTLDVAEAAWQAGKAQIETREAKLRAAEADILVADSKVAVAEAELKNLKALVGYATIKAPFDGVITKRWVDRGATIKDAGAPLLTVMAADTVRVVLDVPERHVPLLNARERRPDGEKPADKVTLRFPALTEAVENGEFAGEITRVASALDPLTRTMRAEVHLRNADGHLKHGMQGTAVILLDERYNVLTVPSTALVRRREQVELFVVADPKGEPKRGAVKRVAVKLGVDDGRRVEIRDGLKGGELVIAKGNGVIREGETVIAVPPRE